MDFLIPCKLRLQCTCHFINLGRIPFLSQEKLASTLVVTAPPPMSGRPQIPAFVHLLGWETWKDNPARQPSNYFSPWVLDRYLSLYRSEWRFLHTSCSFFFYIGAFTSLSPFRLTRVPKEVTTRERKVVRSPRCGPVSTNLH